MTQEQTEQLIKWVERVAVSMDEMTKTMKEMAERISQLERNTANIEIIRG